MMEIPPLRCSPMFSHISHFSFSLKPGGPGRRFLVLPIGPIYYPLVGGWVGRWMGRRQEEEEEGEEHGQRDK